MKPPGNAPAVTFDFLQPPRAVDEMGRLGPYRILRVLGSGAMGVVFLAEDTRGWRQVALKALKPNIPNAEQARKRFLREGHATADLHHDHVITIHDVGQSGDVPYLAMEYLQGETLEAYVKREGGLAIAEVLRVGRETAEGLAAAHGHGLVHRDIKPSNLWLEGERRRVKILDFGLARHTGIEQTNLTQAGFIVGTPSFMSPEQAKGETVDARSDLFSLGCVLYQIATGEVPFRGKDTVATLMALAMDPPMPPRERRPDVPPELNHLILRLLAKQPDQRPPTAEIVAQAIRVFEKRQASGPVSQRPPAGTAASGVVDVEPAETAELAVELTASSGSYRRPRRRIGPMPIVIGASIFILLVFLMVLVLAWPRGGTVSLDTDDNDVEIALLDQDREVAVLDRKSRPEARLPVGEYEVVVRKSRDGLRLSTERVTLSGGGSAVVRITHEAPTAPIGPGALVSHPPRLPNVESWTLDTREHRGPIRVAALSPDGKWLATGANDATVRVWSYPECDLVRILMGHTGAVTSLSWADDGRTLISAGEDKKAYLWDLADPNHTKPSETSVGPGPSPTVTVPNGNKVAVASGRVLLLEAKTNNELKVLLQPRPSSPIVTLAAAPDGKSMASIHADGSIRVWDANSGRPLQAFKAADAPARLLAWSPDGKRLATCHGPMLRLWDVETGTEAKNHTTAPLNAMAWSSDGKWLALASAGPQLQFWNVDTSEARTVKPGASSSVAWSPDGRAVVVGGDTIAEIWDLGGDKPRVKCERPPNAGPLTAVAWAPDGKAVAETNDTGTRLYDPKTGKLLPPSPFTVRPPPAPPLVPRWSPDGRTLLCGAAGKAELRHAPTYNVPLSLPPAVAGPCTWSADSRTLAYTLGGEVRLLAADTRTPRGVVLSPGTDQAASVLTTGHYRTASGDDNEMRDVVQTDRGQQTMTPAEFGRVYGWKNDGRWVRFNER